VSADESAGSFVGQEVAGTMRKQRWRDVAALARQRGIRAQSVASAVLVVLVALLAGGVGLVYLLQLNLESTARDAAQTRANEVASMVQAQGASTAFTAIEEESRSGQLVQILSADGQVLGASSHVVATTPMSPARPDPGDTTIDEVDLDHVGHAGDWMVVSTGVEAGETAYVVQVAIPIEVQRETVQTVTLFLLAATPLLVVGVGLAVWVLVGRALRAVERIRAEVATIDDQRLAQRVAVPQTHDEIAALAETMNTMLDRLETSQYAQRAFVSDASHELRSPLATLTTATELALRGDEATRSRLLGTIGSELARVSTLVDNLMTLARADAHDLLTVRDDVDLDDLVDAEVRRLRATSVHHVVADIEPVRLAGGDTQRIAQALRNLVDNAERHAKTSIRLTLRSIDGQAELDVDNDGPVVPPPDRERIFERFVRLDASRSRDAGGSGLGLAIARTSVESHGGTLRVLDSPDGWCRFAIVVPTATPAATAQPARGHSADPPKPMSLGTPDALSAVRRDRRQ
jgi:signal transduction histidine kinase